jgi:hypothetical protein
VGDAGSFALDFMSATDREGETGDPRRIAKSCGSNELSRRLAEMFDLIFRAMRCE